MARRRGNAPRQVMGRDFAQQSEARSNFALSAKRATDAGAGNTGEGAFAGVYRKRRPTKAAAGGSLNFARRKQRGGQARQFDNYKKGRDQKELVTAQVKMGKDPPSEIGWMGTNKNWNPRYKSFRAYQGLD